MSRTISSLALLVAALTSPSASGESPSPAKPDPARALYAQRCATCHGATGGGDGLGAMGLTPRPRALRDASWQATVTDAQLTTAIVKGGSALGKSSLMSSNPDLANQPELLAALVRYVRSLAEKPSQPTETR